MKKFFLFAAAVATAMTMNAEPKVVVLNEVANYIDFQALSVSNPDMVSTTITSTNTYELPNGSVLKGFQKSDGTEAEVKWNVKEDYNTTMPTPDWAGVDSLKAGTMFRAASGASIELGAFRTADAGKLIVYFQPNGDSERGVSVTIFNDEPVEIVKSGVKIDGIRPAYAGEVALPAGTYDAGDVTIKLITNTSNIFGVAITGLATAVENVSASAKSIKTFENGQVVIIKNGVKYNVLGTELR